MKDLPIFKLYLRRQILIFIFLALTGCGSFLDENRKEQNTQPATDNISGTQVPTIVKSMASTIPGKYIPTLATTSTIKPTGTPTLTLLETQTMISLQPSPDTRISSLLPGYPLVLLISEDNARFYFLNIVTGEIWKLNLPPIIGTYDFIDWSKNGCELILGPNNTIGGSVIRTDLRGDLLQTMLSFTDINITVGKVALTTSMNLLAYSGAGNYLPESESYHLSGTFLEVVDLNSINVRNRISESFTNRYDLLSWSPNGEWLAYGEIDSNQVVQVVISRSDGTGRRQLTHFTDPKAELNTLTWSPGGKGIAFYYYPDLNQGPETYLVIVADINAQDPPHFLELNGSIINITNFWWNSDQIIIVHPFGPLLWIDVTNEQVVDTLDDSNISEGYIMSIHPIADSSLIGFFSVSYDSFYIYNPSIHEFIQFQQKLDYSILDIPIQNWVITPSNFPGEGDCNK